MTDSMANSPTRTLSVRQSGQKALAWVSFVLFGAAAILSLHAGATRPSLVFLFLVGVAIYLLLSTGAIQMNTETITSRLPLGTFRIRWDEVQTIEYDYKQTYRIQVVVTGKGIFKWSRNVRVRNN